MVVILLSIFHFRVVVNLCSINTTGRVVLLLIFYGYVVDILLCTADC